MIRELLNRENIETQSIVFYAKRFPVVESPGTVRDMRHFYEKLVKGIAGALERMETP